MLSPRSFTRIIKQHPGTGTCKGMIPRLTQSRTFAEKKDSKIGKGGDPINNPRMPGIINPEVLNEEGYFSQKAKEQLKELKNKIPDLGKSLVDSDKKS